MAPPKRASGTRNPTRNTPRNVRKSNGTAVVRCLWTSIALAVLSFLFVCGTNRKLLVLPIFEFQTPVLMITVFICGLEAATKKRAQTLNMFKLSTAIQVLEGPNSIYMMFEGTSKGLRFSCLGFWVKGFMCWLVQVAKSFLRTSFFDLSLVSIANVLKRGSYHKKKGFDKGFSTTGSSLIRPGNALFWPAIKKDVFFLVGWGEVYLKYPSIWS